LPPEALVVIFGYQSYLVKMNVNQKLKYILELELWASPCTELTNDDAYRFADIFYDKIDPDRSIYIPLSSAPSETDVKNLALDIAEHALCEKDFFSYCQQHKLEPSITNPISAQRFLDYSFGRRLAWLHIPDDMYCEGRVRRFIDWASGHNFSVVEPDHLYCLINV
jgi:hypothetical protein